MDESHRHGTREGSRAVVWRMNRRGSLATIALECRSGACRGKALECVRNRLTAHQCGKACFTENGNDHFARGSASRWKKRERRPGKVNLTALAGGKPQPFVRQLAIENSVSGGPE